MTTINHEIKIEASSKEVFQALNTLNALKAWHTASIEGKTELNEVLSFKAKDKPSFLWKIIQLEPNTLVTWECVQGPGDAVGTQVIYKISETTDHHTLLEFSHTFWPDQEGNFRKCNTLWGILLHHLKNYIETNKVDPAFS